LLLDKVVEPIVPLYQFNASKVVQWGPPQSNWNPWLAVKIYNPVSAVNFANLLLVVFIFTEKHS